MKREYAAGRARLKGKQGARIWESWSTLAYDLDTVAGMKPRASKQHPEPPATEETTMA